MKRGLPPGHAEVTRQIIASKRIDEQKAVLERRLQEAERLEAMGRLAEGIAHDFRANFECRALSHDSRILLMQPHQGVAAALPTRVRAREILCARCALTSAQALTHFPDRYQGRTQGTVRPRLRLLILSMACSAPSVIADGALSASRVLAERRESRRNGCLSLRNASLGRGAAF